MRIIFIGTVYFSKKMLEKVISMNAEIIGVFTKCKSNFNADFADLKPLCDDNNIPCFFVENINTDDTIEVLENLKPDIIFCFGWSQILSCKILNIPPMGVIGFHPAKIPQNRGRHPLIWALALGLKESASTFFFMDEGADTGDILCQKTFEILYEDTAETLYHKVESCAQKQIEKFLPKLINGTRERIPQQDLKANYWRKRSIEDGKIDFRMTSYSIYNLVRALSKPYVGAHICYETENIKIWKVKEVEHRFNNIECGKVLEVSNDFIVVKCDGGAVKFLEHEFKKIPEVGEYL